MISKVQMTRLGHFTHHHALTHIQPLYFAYDGKEIDDVLLDRCARLVGENYGIWGINPTATKAYKAGSSPPFLHLLNKTNQNSGSQSRCLVPDCASSAWRSPTVRTQGHHELDGLDLVGLAFATDGIMITVSVCHRW
jgi:hypothetical protein